MPNLHPDACQDEIQRPTGDDGWLGSDPRRMDSDHYTWSEVVPTSLAVPETVSQMVGKHIMALIKKCK